MTPRAHDLFGSLHRRHVTPPVASRPDARLCTFSASRDCSLLDCVASAVSCCAANLVCCMRYEPSLCPLRNTARAWSSASPVSLLAAVFLFDCGFESLVVSGHSLTPYLLSVSHSSHMGYSSCQLSHALFRAFASLLMHRFTLCRPRRRHRRVCEFCRYTIFLLSEASALDPYISCAAVVRVFLHFRLRAVVVSLRQGLKRADLCLLGAELGCSVS